MINWKNIVGLPLIHEGKVRLTFEIPGRSDLLLMIATDQISTHNVVHDSLIPQKGEVLTALTVFWTTVLPRHLQSHIVAHGKQIYDFLPKNVGHNTLLSAAGLHKRAIVVRKLEMIPYEFIYRAYLTGSLWKSYDSGKPNPYGIHLPKGLSKMHRFDNQIFTPTDKSEEDNPVNSGFVIGQYQGASWWATQAFERIRSHLNWKGIELVDSKFELGYFGGGVHLAIGDEIVTPDSSRFCELSSIKEGEDPPWLDKQIVRDEVESYFGSYPISSMSFSSQTIRRTSDVYLKIFERITGMTLSGFQKHNLNNFA